MSKKFKRRYTKADPRNAIPTSKGPINGREGKEQKGPAKPFGIFGIVTDEGELHFDAGAWWFRDISHLGYRCKDFPGYDYLSHTGNGDAALFHKEQYLKNEVDALKKLQQDFAEELEIMD